MKLTRYKRQSLKQIENGKQVKYMLINNDDHYYEMGKCGFKLQKKNQNYILIVCSDEDFYIFTIDEIGMVVVVLSMYLCQRLKCPKIGQN